MMGCGLLIDAFLVRTQLVPAIIVLVGEAAARPGARLRAPAVRPAPPERPSPIPGRNGAETSAARSRLAAAVVLVGVIAGVASAVRRTKP